ncbi:serine hydrolase domain-containing protein [Phenylobacterium sp.]|uniref:serine hydrolase domain-containing protein n=1 Tax=Phenylobacterium sp. TaxID=1871053 RepID=UPI002C769A99|nr:serine hydrolase domain-containing protein [Phenylobacterium sp.]HVI32444.1 serine hydrolase domain-containing protein [Phenylobacterium sp.]
MGQADRIADALAAYVEAGQLAGAAALVWRPGREARVACAGWRDMEAGLPVARDTLFRIASLTKPVTSLAALTMLEEGRFALDEPITRWAPEFARMRVLRAVEGPLDATVPAERPITFEDLLTHRSGLTYGDFHQGPIARAYAEALGPDIDSPVPPETWIANLARLPLTDQPGTAFRYGRATDLLGFLLARIEGAPLGEVLQRRVLGPLGMADTGFVVPPEKRDRAARMYGFDDAGRLVRYVPPPGAPFLADRPAGMTYVSGGAGLWSTLDDYLVFARVFVEAGAPGGARLLRPETVALMTADRLTAEQRAQARLLGMNPFEGHGFGLGVAVVIDPAKAPVVRCRGGVGTVGWPGAFGGWWQADPTDGSVMIFLAHNQLQLEQLARGIGLGVYGAISEFHAMASAG